MHDRRLLGNVLHPARVQAKLPPQLVVLLPRELGHLMSSSGQPPNPTRLSMQNALADNG